MNGKLHLWHTLHLPDLHTRTLLKPFYMWAGGKSKLLKHYEPILPDTSQYTHYIEPFFGGGAMYASLADSFDGEFIVGDVNTELMGLLEALRDDMDTVVSDARRVLSSVLKKVGKDSRKAEYYVQREAYWSDPKPGHLYALMRLGFNGIWQTAKASNGLFATPAGLLNQVDADSVLDLKLLSSWSEKLQHTSVHTGSYADIVLPEGSKCLIYLDPPYRDSFTSYSTTFGDVEQLELIEWAAEVADSGHTVMLANRCVDGDTFFEERLPEADFHYFDVVYTAGRRKKVEGGFEAKPAREFLAII